MTGRRGWGEDSIYFDHSGECRDPETHRHCPGRWRGVVSLKPGPDGQWRRKKVSGKNKTEVRAKLADLHDELNEPRDDTPDPGVVGAQCCTRTGRT